MSSSTEGRGLALELAAGPPGHIAGPALEPREASPVLSRGWLPRVMALQSRCHLRMQSEARKAVPGKRTSFFLSLAAVTQASSCSLCARNPEMMLPPPPTPPPSATTS